MLVGRLPIDTRHVPEEAMVLAAGRGERLRPLTDELPKPLITIGGTTILDRSLDALAEAGVERAVVNAAWLADRIADHVADRTRPGVIVSREDEAQETGGGVARALSHFGEAPFLVLNGDSVWLDGMTSTIPRFCRNWDAERMDILLLLYPFARVTGKHGVGDFTMDPEGRLARREESRVAPFAYMGVSMVHPRIFVDLPDGPFSMNVLYDRAEEAGRLFGAVHDGLWYHISTPADLDLARRRFATGHEPDSIYL